MFIVKLLPLTRAYDIQTKPPYSTSIQSEAW